MFLLCKVGLALLVGHLNVVFANILLLCCLSIAFVIDQALNIVIVFFDEKAFLVSVLANIVKINVCKSAWGYGKGRRNQLT